MNYTRYAIYFILTVIIGSCAEQENSFSAKDSPIVVEGWIEVGGFPVVMLSLPFPISSDYQDIKHLEDYVLRWAKVTVSCEDDSVILTGIYDKSYFPPYIYTTSKLRGQAGRQYRLTVEYDGKTATASTTIPKSMADCSFHVERCEDTDSLYLIMAHINNTSEGHSYYQLFSVADTQSDQYLLSYLGSIDGRQYAQEIDYPVYRGHQTDNDDYTPYFHIDDSVSVACAQVDETSYRIFDSYSKELTLSGNMFLSVYSNLITNIEGGYGYWCGLAAVHKNIIILQEINNNNNNKK